MIMLCDCNQEAGCRVRPALAGLATVALAVGLLATWPYSACGQTLPAQQTAAQTDWSTLPPPAAATPDTLSADSVAPEASDSYIIGNQDLLSVFVFQMPPLTRQVRVNDQGEIRLPFVPQPILATGTTARALSERIGNALVRARLAQQPTVQVVVRQVMSKPIVVNGQVATPVTLQAARPVTVLEALTRAGGVTKDAGNIVLLTSHLHHNPQLQELHLDDVMRQSASSRILLTGDEALTVMPAPLVYAVGDLKTPGAFPIRTAEPVTVLRVIALAQGTNASANRGKAVIIHSQVEGERAMTPIDLDKIVKRKISDPVLAAGDIVYVPRNGRKVVMTQALQDVAQMAVIAIGYHW